jgi:hypothetical protein
MSDHERDCVYLSNIQTPHEPCFSVALCEMLGDEDPRHDVIPVVSGDVDVLNSPAMSVKS